MALLDCTLAGLTNLAQYYLTSGAVARRQGNAHATIVPYQAFEAADGWMVVAVGNDRQFKRFAHILGHDEWGEDIRFSKNQARVQNRDILVPLIETIIKTKNVDDWIGACRDADVPAGPVNKMDQVFAMEQVAARAMRVPMNHPLSPTPIDLVGSPLKLSDNAVTYRMPPPL